MSGIRSAVRAMGKITRAKQNSLARPGPLPTQSTVRVAVVEPVIEDVVVSVPTIVRV